MPAFGAKTITDLVKEVESDASKSALEVAGNSSIKMKSTEALQALAPGLKAHKAIKTLDLTDCEITDGGCEVLADIFANNHVIETVILERNKISSAGAGKLADGLAQNKGIRTMNLLQQAVKSFGDECLDKFILMYGTNITLTKMTWRLDSRKSFMLAKLQTRNIEIQKAKAAGKDFEHLLPDNLKSGAPAAAAAPAPAAEPAPAMVARKSTVEDIAKHVEAIEKESAVVQAAGSVQASWDNHFAAFGGQDVEKILQDYTEKSVITVYDQTTGAKTVYSGLEGVRACFVGLFKSLFDLSDLAAPVVEVQEASAGEPGSVFLVWYCPASGYRQATDTFIFDESSKILWQNVVVVYQDPKGDGTVVAKNDQEAPAGSGAVHDGWANHFAAFGGQDVEKILLDYVEESEITVFNHADGSKNVFKGLAGAKSCFEGLFKSLFDCSNLAAPIIHVEESVSGAAGQVFLIWCCPASGYARATDTFVFNSAGKITRQNVVVHYEAAGSGSMPAAAKRLLLAEPKVTAPLDPGFRPVILGKKKYLEAAAGCADRLEWALPRADGCGRGGLPVFPEGSEDAEASVYLAGVLIQEMMWQRSGAELLLAGPPGICEKVAADFREGGRYEFEIKSMPNVCGTPERPFNVTVCAVGDLPENRDTPQVCGKDASGCRLAFDLGKSDIKVVAVKDNEVVYSKETEWDVTNPDPQYHFDAIVAAMQLGKDALPQVDAIGGSATGTVSGANEATWCDIFPNVPPDVYKEKVVDIFVRIAKHLAGDVPLKVINDGEVTALAAVQKINKGNVMGISMGSSEGGGYANADGNLMGWINELCYIRLDLNPDAPTDPWTKGAHTGVSHMYLGQRGATKLAAAAGVEVPDNQRYPHPEMCTIKHENHAQALKKIQAAMADPAKTEQTSKLYETVGVYLGYGLAQYCEFYKIDHVMILGRVSKGAGGDLMLATAKKVLETEFPEYAGMEFHTADDHFKAVGQCIAAAALPEIK